MAPQVLDPATYRVMVFTLSGSVEGPHPRSAFGMVGTQITSQMLPR